MGQMLDHMFGTTFPIFKAGFKQYDNNIKLKRKQ